MASIEEKFAELVAAGFQPLGNPPVIPLPLPDGVGTFFTFVTTGGPVTIYHHPDVGAFEVHGAILTAYLGQQGPQGDLGYPVSDEYDNVVGGQVVGRVNDFQAGSIFWDAASGEVQVVMSVPLPTTDFEIIVGIDVSTFQGTIDWQRVATQGTTDGETVQFAYIKASEGNTGRDARFAANWANSNGLLPRGAYHFFRATSVVDGTRPQADNFIAVLNATGDIGELPPMVDVESLPAGVTAAQAEASLMFFLQIVEQAFGRRLVIYTYPSFWSHGMANSQTFSQSFHLWIANYGAKRADGGFEARRRPPVIPGGWPTFSIWQNAVKPGVPGIQGLVDRDVAVIPSNVDLATFLLQIPGQ